MFGHFKSPIREVDPERLLIHLARAVDGSRPNFAVGWPRLQRLLELGRTPAALEGGRHRVAVEHAAEAAVSEAGEKLVLPAGELHGREEGLLLRQVLIQDTYVHVTNTYFRRVFERVRKLLGVLVDDGLDSNRLSRSASSHVAAVRQQLGEVSDGDGAAVHQSASEERAGGVGLSQEDGMGDGHAAVVKGLRSLIQRT